MSWLRNALHGNLLRFLDSLDKQRLAKEVIAFSLCFSISRYTSLSKDNEGRAREFMFVYQLVRFLVMYIYYVSYRESPQAKPSLETDSL